MIFPSGPENTPLRRVPWASFAIMALGLLVYMVYLVLPEPNVKPMTDAIRYRLERPYLKGHPQLDRLAQKSDIRVIYQQVPEDSEQLARQQATLDALAKTGFRAFNRHPIIGWTLIPAKFSLFGWFFHITFHTSLFILLGNMLFLYITGPYLEDRWGRLFFPLFYVGAGLVSSLGMVILYPDSWVPIAGSSGAVAAVMGAYTVRFHHLPMRFELMSSLFLKDHFTLSPLAFFPLWFAVQFALTWFTSTQFGVDYLAYWLNIWGFFFGVVVALVIKLAHWEPYLYQSEFEKLPLDQQFRIRLERAQKTEDGESVWKLIGQAHQAFPEDPDFLRQLWEQSVRVGKTRDAVNQGRRLIKAEIEAGAHEAAFFHWRELTRSLPGETLPLDQTCALAQGLLANDHRHDAKVLVNYSFENLTSFDQNDHLLLLADTASFVDPGTCVKGIDFLLQQTNLDEELRRQLTLLMEETLQLYPTLETSDEPPQIELSAPPEPLDLTADEDVFSPTRIQQLKPHEGILQTITNQGLDLLLNNGTSKLLPFSKIRAVAVGAIREIGSQPFLILDIFVDHPIDERQSHSFLRLNSKNFNPLRVVKDSKSPAAAIRSMVKNILERSDADPLPDEESLLGKRFLSFASVAEFEKELYGVNGG